MKVAIFALALCGAAISLWATTANGAIKFSEDFNDINIPSDPLNLTASTPGSSFTTNVTPTTGAITARIDSDGSLFGTPGNQYLEFIDGNSTAGMRGPTTSISAVPFEVSFDFYDPSATVNRLGVAVDSATRFTLGNGASGAASATNTRSVDISFKNGTLQYVNNGGTSISVGTYTEGVAHSLQLIVNYTSSTFNYQLGGSQSVAPGTFDVFIDGTLLPGDGVSLVGGDNVPFRNPVTVSTQLGFLGNGNISISETYFDNIVLQTFDPLPGDFDGNGLVDGADFAAWQAQFPIGSGATLAQGDADGDGDVDGADFVVWQTHYTPPSNPAVAIVPEPTATTLTALGALLTCWFGKQTGRQRKTAR